MLISLGIDLEEMLGWCLCFPYEWFKKKFFSYSLKTCMVIIYIGKFSLSSKIKELLWTLHSLTYLLFYVSNTTICETPAIGRAAFAHNNRTEAFQCPDSWFSTLDKIQVPWLSLAEWLTIIYLFLLLSSKISTGSSHAWHYLTVWGTGKDIK